uniref:C2H2-type domain-containing protein n=1 Tax=Glossina brevipalpis TaxID=37001 RepID=A0A1A9WRG1_9MUSC
MKSLGYYLGTAIIPKSAVVASLMVSLILPSNSNARQTVASNATRHDFVVLEDLPQLDASLANQDSPTAHDQLLASMVDEFLKDPCDTERPTQDLEEELNKATSLHIEYLEEPSSQVDDLIDFHHHHHHDHHHDHHDHHQHHDIRDSGSVESSSTTSSSLLTLSSANSLTHLIDLPSNVKEISYQRFGRLNHNYWTISVKSVTSLNNIALEEIKQKQRRLRQHSEQNSPSSTDGSGNSIVAGSLYSQTIHKSPGDLNNVPHVCPRCEKIYTYKKNLSRHLRFECGILPSEKCQYCGYLTRYKYSLNVHIKTQHPEHFSSREKCHKKEAANVEKIRKTNIRHRKQSECQQLKKETDGKEGKKREREKEGLVRYFSRISSIFFWVKLYGCCCCLLRKTSIIFTLLFYYYYPILFLKPSVKHDKSEQTDITPEEFELDDCLLESNDIVITQNKDGFVLHAIKLPSSECARPLKQESSQLGDGGQTTATTYELSLSDSSLGASEDRGDEAKYVCRHCGKKYRWKSTLRRHENVECGGKEPCHPCPYCSYKAKQRGNLGVHVRKHHPDKPQLESKRGRKVHLRSREFQEGDERIFYEKLLKERRRRYLGFVRASSFEENG